MSRVMCCRLWRSHQHSPHVMMYVEPVWRLWPGEFSVTAQHYITTMKMYCLDMERPIIYFNILILEMVL